MGSSPARESALCVFKGLEEYSIFSPIAAEEQALSAELLRRGGRGIGCGSYHYATHDSPLPSKFRGS